MSYRTKYMPSMLALINAVQACRSIVGASVVIDAQSKASIEGLPLRERDMLKIEPLQNGTFVVTLK